MQSCCKAYPTYKDNCNMDLTPVTLTNDRQREVESHLGCGNVVL
jgi:hypothetical protein